MNQKPSDINWSKQHCGVHQATMFKMLELMPDLVQIVDSFRPATGWSPLDFTWDVKVHMLMPRQYPCIPGWHVDNIPRSKDGRQMFDKANLELPMFMWLSGGPLTQFRDGYILPKKWVKFYQNSEHRGQAASEFTWRGFIRATHKDIMPPKEGDWLRRHCQVYIDEPNYQW